MLNFSQFRVFTFDCYGTLVDWEAGILAALRGLLAAHPESRQELSDAQLLGLYAEFEAFAEKGEYKQYRIILEDVVQGIASRLGFKTSAEEKQSLAESLPFWSPFPDTVAALRKLKTRYKLGIISNVDDDLFAHTARKLEVPFDFFISAQQAGSYKPSPNNFLYALKVIGEPRENILHVAQSLYHDIPTAKSLGMSTIWVNRKRATIGVSGGVPPDLEVPDLQTLAAMACA